MWVEHLAKSSLDKELTRPSSASSSRQRKSEEFPPHTPFHMEKLSLSEGRDLIALTLPHELDALHSAVRPMP